jgi:rubrerythrin
MRFLDTLTNSLSTGVDRVRFETEKFQRSGRISGEINNVVSQIETNTRQLGERALELYQQGTISAPEIASLAQIISQLREQQAEKERELEEVQNESFEAWHARQPQPSATDESGDVQASAGEAQSVNGAQAEQINVQPAAGTAPYACSNCGYALPANAIFCPNCGVRVAGEQA